MKEKEFSIEEVQSGMRIDRFLASVCHDLSRSYLQTLMNDGAVTVSGKSVKPSYKIKTGEKINIAVPDPVSTEVTPEDLPLDILYEDDDVLIVNKPKGMVVHPSAGHREDTLVNAVLFHCKGSLSGINGKMRPGIVHRIDKDTTGALIVCKNDKAHRLIAAQLKTHSITRRYRGIVIGHLPKEQGTIEGNIGRDKKNRKRMAIDAYNGKPAITHYRVLERMDGYDSCEFTLETGRTHQIRVHMASAGHPILGDELYGPKKCPYKLEGQTLHAMTIGFVHPSTGKYEIGRASCRERV